MRRSGVYNIIFFIIMAFFLIIVLPERQGDPGIARAGEKPSVTIIKTVHQCKSFIDDVLIHPSRYVLSYSKTTPWAPAVYDISDGRIYELPKLDAIRGLPAPPEIPQGENSRYIVSRYKLEGKYWRWYDKRMVNFNAESNRCGIMYTKSEVRKTVQGDPPCPKCGGTSSFIEKYSRYYCNQCRSYVPEENYLGEVFTSYYALMDIPSGSISWMAELEMDASSPYEQHGILPIGVDPTGKYFYYSNKIFMYKHNRSSGNILLYRFNIDSRKVDWNYRISVPVRYKTGAAPSYSYHVFPSVDCSKIVFWEYDELASGQQGYLKNPPARGYVVDTALKSHTPFTIPVTAYGNLVSYDGRYLFLGSNQTGYIHRYDLQSKKEDLKIQSKKNIFKFILSKGSRFLYAFNKRGVEVYAFPSLTLIQSIPLKSIFPGVSELLVSERVYVTDGGGLAVIGILKKEPNGDWYASDRDDGFHLLKIGD